MEDYSINKSEIKEVKTRKPRILKIFLVIGFVIVIYYFLSSPAKNDDVIIHIASDQSVDSVYSLIADKKIIRNEKVLKLFVRIMNPKGGVISGDYLIKKNSPVWVIAWQIGRGHHNIEAIKITIREGLTNEEMATLLSKKLTGFQKELFLNKTKDKQGYLFPDTYFLYPLDTVDEIVGKLSNNFNNRTKNIYSLTSSKGKSFSSIIIMASILEGEAGGKEDISIISGILWKRISLGMRLQVDIDKRTYTTEGLSEKPLNNPGLSSIEAALNPVDSPYLYYLHDKNGKVHYATSYEEHKKNINNYLK